MSSPTKTQRNEGEGNKTADRRYRQEVREHIDKGDVEREAAAAREALEGPEGDALRAAEAEGKRRAAGEDQ